ncbi:putative deoxyguanosinetriphosphate triphosphohydrolase [Clostridium sp. CAG:356]|nr:putative deoxyguanosinetriphosphate triphosphohydrolase [Clostridium sp. CAG:356]
MKNEFEKYATNENNPKWQNSIKREKEIYKRKNDIRSEFERDYNRILHCNAYRRMKHKTQVFFSPENDHICTRIEHVMHVESVSYTIAKYLGLNTELTKAIATGHDIGHSPFGHEGERILSQISERDIGEKFWHERNGMEFVDKIELLEDINKNKQNLNLTYAVRDGIISHCGEIDENCLKPREENINLNNYKVPNQYSPYTWEGCVVKISDKISYLGRDIEDAISLGILDEKLKDLYKILQSKEVINNTVIINHLIWDLCENSTPEKGLCFSDETFNLLKEIKDFNYKHIYTARKIKPAIRYFSIVLNEIYFTLKSTYDGKNTAYKMRKLKKMYPEVVGNFQEWLENYWNQQRKNDNQNDIIVNMDDEKSFSKAIIYYISGMTDNFAIDTYNKIIGF